VEKRWTVVIAFLGIFIAGGVTGALLTLRFAPQHTITTFVTATPSASQGSTSTSTVGPATPGTINSATANNVGAVAAPRPLVPPEQITPQLFRRITNQLNLTPPQRQKIRPVELRATEEIGRIRRDSLHATQVIIDKTEDEIRNVLNPDQAAKFDVLVGQQREKIEKFLLEQQRRQREQRDKMLQGRAGGAPGAQVKGPGQGGTPPPPPPGTEEKKED
jgi:hypothetical protein